MKILIFNWRDPTHPWAGGAEVFLFENARRWVQQGHHVTWFCGRHKSQPATACIEGINIIRRGGIYTVYPAAVGQYISQLRGRFDILLDSANGIPFFTPLFSRVPKIALVHHIHHEVFFRELPWHLAHIGNALERLAMPWIYQHTQFVAVSKSSQYALMDIGVPEAHIKVIHNGLDHSQYRPGAESNKPLMVFLGRLRHYKSVDVAIRAMPILLRDVPDLEFSIVGSGLAEASLRQLSQEIGVENHVQFHGHVSEVEKIRLLQQAHVVVNTSMKEGWGLTVIEANACGTPVVAANVPGLCDSVQHGKTGVLVPYGDTEALAAAVCEILLDTDRRAWLSKNAVTWAANFTWDQTAQLCLQLMRQVID